MACRGGVRDVEVTPGGRARLSANFPAAAVRERLGKSATLSPKTLTYYL